MGSPKPVRTACRAVNTAWVGGPLLGLGDPDETGYLDPIHAQLALGKSPGRVVLERWEAEWERSLDRLIDYARY